MKAIHMFTAFYEVMQPHL